MQRRAGLHISRARVRPRAEQELRHSRVARPGGWIVIELMTSDRKLKARNEGSTGPKRLNDTRCTTYKRRINYRTEALNHNRQLLRRFHVIYAANFAAPLATVHALSVPDTETFYIARKNTLQPCGAAWSRGCHVRPPGSGLRVEG